MNWDQVEGKWKQVKGSFREKWGKFSDSDLETLGGKKDQIVGKLQEKYGLSKEDADKHLDEWRNSLDKSDTTSSTVRPS